MTRMDRRISGARNIFAAGLVAVVAALGFAACAGDKADSNPANPGTYEIGELKVTDHYTKIDPVTGRVERCHYARTDFSEKSGGPSCYTPNASELALLREAGELVVSSD